MAKQIPFTKYEAALLLESYLKVLSGELSRMDAIKNCSRMLRAMAINLGIKIDDTYRNVNGISFQMSSMESAYQGCTGLKPASRLFTETVLLFRSDNSAYQELLKEAKSIAAEKQNTEANMTNPAKCQVILEEANQMIEVPSIPVEDAFFAYAKEKSDLSPQMLADYLQKAANYCHLKQPLLGMTDMKAVHNVQQKVAGGKLLRFRFGKDTQVIRNVTQLYYAFIKSYRESKENIITQSTYTTKDAVVEQATSDAVEQTTEKNVPTIPVEEISTLDENVEMAENVSLQEGTIGVPAKDPRQPIKETPIIPTGEGQISLDAFKRFLTQEKGFADRPAGNYWTSIRMIEAYIQRNHLDFSLLNTDATGAQKIFNLLMARPDFEQINIQRHRQFSAALVQFVDFLRQDGSITPGGEQKLAGKKTIIETVFDVLRQAGKPMTVSEIYQVIIRGNLYPFGAQNPQSVVYSKVSLACRQTDARIKEGRDVLIRAEEDGRKVFQVMSAKEAAAFFENQQRKSELETVSSWAEYKAVLKQAFPKGFQKESGLDMKKLRKRWAEIHGKELKDSDKTVRLQLTANCVDTGKRWYLAELLLSDEDRRTVLRYIEYVLNSGKPVLYYSSIYTALEHQLESAVLTEDLLVSYLLATCQDRYILREHYLTNDQHAQVNLPEEIKDVMLAYGRPIHTDELKQALHYLPPDQVERELRTHSAFIMDALHMYFHESMVDLTDQELNQIAAFIQEELDDQGYMTGDWIQRKLVQLYPETAERLSFLTPLGVRGAMAYKLRNRFTFSGPVITPKGKAMNMTDIFAMFCQHHAPFTLDELAAFAKECDSTIYMDTVHRNCARVSETEFVETGAVHWDIPHVDAAIALHCPGKYVSLKNIQYFDAFPYVGYSWNSYLLEQYVATVSKEFTLMHSSYAKNNTSGAIVRRDAGLDSFDDVLADILANAPVDLEKNPCLEHLANAGYITRKKLSNIKEIITRAKMLRSQKG